MKILPAAEAAAVPVRPASTTLILRDADAGVELLMVRRSLRATFMPGAYVFPGGAVDTVDHHRAGGASPHAVAAVRECREECGLELDAGALVPWSRWVTPLGLPKRFDTMFFVCRAPEGQQAVPDAAETTTIAWVRPGAALQAHARGEHPMEFATVRTVQSLLPFAAADVKALLDHAAALAALPSMEPRLRLRADGGVSAILLRGDPGYDSAGPSG